MPIKVDPNSIGVLQSRPPNPFTPKLSNSQFGPNGSIWKFLAYTLVYPSEGGGGRIGRDLPTNPKNWVVPSMCTTILPPKYLICNFHVIFCNCPKCPPQVDP